MRNRVAVIISSRLFQRHGKYETHATCLLLRVSHPHPWKKIARLKIYGSTIIHDSDILLIETLKNFIIQAKIKTKYRK